MSEKEELMKLAKKTVKAHGVISEQEAEIKAINPEKISEKMIEKEIKNEIIEELKEKEEIIEELIINDKKSKYIKPERFTRRTEKTKDEIISAWEPKTKLGKEVKSGKIKNIDEILDKNLKILEPEISDKLLNLKTDLISIGQSKGKFGGGKRRAWRQTQRKTQEGNVPTFSTMAVVGDENGHIGIGSGRSQETLPARDKAIRKAKLNVIKITRGCASFDCSCSELHSIPFEVYGKAGSIRIRLTPAPQGTGLVVAKELKKLLNLAGIKDLYSRTSGQKRTTFNLMKACIDALKKTNLKNGGKR